ncbi:MAG: N-sulfoglucosamine sulfohydrolase [Flavobacteriaceae bacterium]|nr:N-sulfoglucosamine sulfohydrolase [Flavobacteriaceae bacterium]
MILKRSAYFIIFFSVLLLTSLLEKSEYSQKANSLRPNIIFYLADDQDRLDYGSYGNPNVETSNVDLLVKQGIKFENFYTGQAICAPSRSQIFTGMYPVKNGCMANHIGVKPNIKSITSLLKESGYEVVLAGKSHVKPNKVFNWTHYFPKLENRFLPLAKIDDYLKNVKKPFCLIIASDYPHGPFPKTLNYTKKDIYKLPYDPSYMGNHKPGYYQNIKDDNDQLGEVLNMVDNYGHNENSMFIYASDHGLSGKWGLSEQGLQVPFVVRWPGKIKPNSTSNTLLTLVDVLPTLLEVSKTKIPKDIDGKSFVKTLLGSDEEINEYVFGVATKQNIRECKIFPSRMVREKRFKLIRNFNSIEVFDSNLGDNPFVNSFAKIGAESFPNIPYEELYDLEKDPYQKINLINDNKYKNIRNRLSIALENWMLAQEDFILENPISVIKPTLHPLDKSSKWNTVPDDLLGKLKDDDYVKLHY